MELRTILVVGSGARESALARALAASPGVERVLVAPGNAGTELIDPKVWSYPAPLHTIDLVAAALSERVDLVVIGPEAPLTGGLVDALTDAGILAYGPTRAAAVLEGSKVFLKEFAARHQIPTAGFAVAETMDEAEQIIALRGAPIVVKADGLCAGKGVVVATTAAEALGAARAMLVDKRFGDAGARVILEDMIAGEEASVLAISDGERMFVLPAARDHKRVGTGDTGPNTGGMGAFAPAPLVDRAMMARIEREILRPTIDGMRAEGRPFRGTLFAGIMVTPSGEPMLLEHNVRFGDPECESLMALLSGDVAGLLASAARGRLDPARVTVHPSRVAVTVVVAAPGYPDAPEHGATITGFDEAAAVEHTVVDHAGTARRGSATVTSGGRVLAVTSTGLSLDEARERAYRAAKALHFKGAHYRTDIGRADFGRTDIDSKG